MFNIFKSKKKITDEIKEIPLKIKVKEDIDNGTFLKGFGDVKNVRFKDLEIIDRKTGDLDTFKFMEDDLKIMETLSVDHQTGHISYSDYIANSIDNSISYSEVISSPLSNLSSGTMRIGGYIDPFKDYPAVMFDTEEILNDPNLVSIGRSRVTGQHVYRYLGNGSKDLDNIGIPFSELI